MNLEMKHMRNGQQPRAEVRWKEESPFSHPWHEISAHWKKEELLWWIMQESVLQNLPVVTILVSGESFSWGDFIPEALHYETTHGEAAGP